MALSDVALRCEAMSGLGATADIGRRYGLDGSTHLRHGNFQIAAVQLNYSSPLRLSQIPAVIL